MQFYKKWTEQYWEMTKLISYNKKHWNSIPIFEYGYIQMAMTTQKWSWVANSTTTRFLQFNENSKLKYHERPKKGLKRLQLRYNFQIIEKPTSTCFPHWHQVRRFPKWYIIIIYIMMIKIGLRCWLWLSRLILSQIFLKLFLFPSAVMQLTQFQLLQFLQRAVRKIQNLPGHIK